MRNAKRNGGVAVINVLQYTGPVGVASRCIRARQPMVQPTALTSEQVRKLHKQSRRRLRGLLRKANARNDTNNKYMVWKPFIVPFLLPSGALSFTPRLVSYYEVHILKAADDDEEAKVPESDEEKEPKSAKPTTTQDECIVIGMASKEFPLETRLPGWTKEPSFGYHSDDGSAFANQYKTQYGRKFGEGDVVGCGIDYRTGYTFYTLNGQFLGYSFALSQEQLTKVAWYPTVGLDSTACLHCNFGTDQAFRFDLQRFCENEPHMLKTKKSK
uniref:B30.2/SPRY domain-containing protein n=1 Tax=Amphora coffeiformis TaxID=265554 RepID=A0A7S3P703_9STRA